MTILCQNKLPEPLPFDLSDFTETAGQLLEKLQRSHQELSLVLINDQQIKELNRNYRQKNKTTNVLSFPMLDHEEPDDLPQMLGDIVISVETARREAEASKITVIDHMTVLLVHGLVHLLGYNHELGTDEAAAMAAMERELLHSLDQNQKIQPLTTE